MIFILKPLTLLLSFILLPKGNVHSYSIMLLANNVMNMDLESKSVRRCPVAQNSLSSFDGLVWSLRIRFHNSDINFQRSESRFPSKLCMSSILIENSVFSSLSHFKPLKPSLRSPLKVLTNFVRPHNYSFKFTGG